MGATYVLLLKLTDDRDKAGTFMAGHKAWLKRGFDDGIFLLAGGLSPHQGGGILAHGESLPELERRLEEDPFVAEGVVTTEIIEIAPSRADPRLDFLLP